MASDIQLTPMMAQYQRIKRDLPAGALLFFRLGDFYEMFFEDAQVAAPILNVALTKRGAVPMCGIPFHAANGYIARILKSGRKVAICDQVEEARPGQLVKREVTQILSPGTHFDDRLLTAERNNFVAGIFGSGKIFGLAVVDLTTGDFKVTEVIGDLALTTELERLRPVEIIFPDDQRPLQELLRRTFPIASSHEGWVFALETSLYALRDHFKVASLDGFGLRDRPSAIGAAGGLLHYIGQHLRRDLSHLTRLNYYQATDYLVLDSTTLRTLEVLEPQQESSARTASLYGALNRTATPMGARRLRDWLTQPLASVAAIIPKSLNLSACILPRSAILSAPSVGSVWVVATPAIYNPSGSRCRQCPPSGPYSPHSALHPLCVCQTLCRKISSLHRNRPLSQRSISPNN